MTTITINGQEVEATRIDELDQTALQNRDHVVPAMREGVSVKLSVAQILGLLQSGDIPDEAVNETQLAVAVAEKLNSALQAANDLSDVVNAVTARTNIGAAGMIDQRVSTLTLAEFTGQQIFLGPDGSALHDPFDDLSYVDVAGATNLDTSQTGVLKPTIEVDSTPEPDGVFGNPYDGSNFSRAATLDNGKTVQKLGIYMTEALTLKLKIARRNSSTNIDVVYDEEFTHLGNGWQDFNLTTPYEVPGSGTFVMGAYMNTSNPPPGTDDVDRIGGFGSGVDATGDNITTSESVGITFALRATYAIPDLDVSSIPVESAGQAASISLVALMTGDEVLNTDAVFSVSRDEGATWSSAVMSTLYEQSGGVRVLRSNQVDVSGQTAGTHVQWRLETENGADVALRAVAIWGDA